MAGLVGVGLTQAHGSRALDLSLVLLGVVVAVVSMAATAALNRRGMSSEEIIERVYSIPVLGAVLRFGDRHSPRR